jgi:hypothetical protein
MASTSRKLALLPDVVEEVESDAESDINALNFSTPSSSKYCSPKPSATINHNGETYHKRSITHRNCMVYRSDDISIKSWFNEKAFAADGLAIYEYDLVIYNPRQKPNTTPLSTPVVDRTFGVWDIVRVNDQSEKSVVLAIIDILLISEKVKQLLKIDKGVWACVYSIQEKEILFIGVSKLHVAEGALSDVPFHST